MNRFFVGLIATAMASSSAMATTVTDATRDFLATYSGATDASLDIVSASASFDGTNFFLSATTGGTIGLSGSLYVFGINRGAGTPRLSLGSPSIGGTVLWDAVAILFPDGTGRIATLPPAGPPTITNLPGIVTVSGNSISGSFAASLIPSTGFDPADYTFTLWSRLRINPAVDGTNAEIADFAPNSGGFTASVPEPASWILMLLGFGVVGGAKRRSRGVVSHRLHRAALRS